MNLKTLTAGALLCLSPALASAGIINFDFTSTGDGSVRGCGILCLEIASHGNAQEVSGSGNWDFDGLIRLSLTGSSSSWSFTDNTGSNDLGGTFSTNLFEDWSASHPDARGSDQGTLTYQINWGNGLFAGATGWGKADVSLSDPSLFSLTNWFVKIAAFDFQQWGSMYVITPQQVNVPEPGMVTLLSAGLVLLGFLGYRRRRTALSAC